MRRRLLPVFTFAISLAATSPGAAQTLAAKPAVFADPVPGSDPSKGELVLGRTTLAAARRIFAVQLGESVTVPPGRANPDTLPADTEWQVEAVEETLDDVLIQQCSRGGRIGVGVGWDRLPGLIEVAHREGHTAAQAVGGVAK